MQNLLSGVNGLTFLIISHSILCCMLLFFNFQMCSLNFVDDLFRSSLKDDLCRLYLVLNALSVYNAFSEAFSFEWAVFSLSAVAEFF